MALNLRKEDIGLKWFKIFYLQSSCMRNTYVLISKSQLNNDVNSKEKFQKMWISSFMFYLKFFCGCHTNPGLGILPELCRIVYQVSEFFTIFIIERKYQKWSSEFSSLTLEKKV